MANKTLNNVTINMTLKAQTTKSNLSSSSEDLATQMGKLQKWYPHLMSYGISETAAATAEKIVVSEGFQLITGAIIAVKFTYTNSAEVSDVKLNVNSTGAKNVKYRGTSNLPDKGYLAANVTYFFIYDGTYWQWMGDTSYNTNTYDRTSSQNRIYAGGVGVFPYCLCALDSNQRMQAFTTTGGTGTSKVVNTTAEFMYPPVIMYHSANSTIANGSVIANNVLYEQFPNIDLRYSSNITTSAGFTQYKPLYVECTFNTKGLWSITSNNLTQTFVSGKYYILIGIMYNTSIYQVALLAQHPLYYFDGTNLINGEKQLAKENINVTKTTIGSASVNGNISADEITNWTTNTPSTSKISSGVLVMTKGTAASLSHDTKSIPNISVTSTSVVTDVT